MKQFCFKSSQFEKGKIEKSNINTKTACQIIILLLLLDVY